MPNFARFAKRKKTSFATWVFGNILVTVPEAVSHERILPATMLDYRGQNYVVVLTLA